MNDSLSSTTAVANVADEPASEPIQEEHQYLTFRLGEEMYAFGILSVREILEYQRPTRVPMMPDFIDGVIGLRGEVVPVVNLARRFGRPDPEITRFSCVVVIEVEREGIEQDLGVLVDSVSEVVDIAPESIRAAPEFGERVGADLVRGMGKVDDEFVILLSEDRVLSMDELSQVSQAESMAAEMHD